MFVYSLTDVAIKFLVLRVIKFIYIIYVIINNNLCKKVTYASVLVEFSYLVNNKLYYAFYLAHMAEIPIQLSSSLASVDHRRRLITFTKFFSSVTLQLNLTKLCITHCFHQYKKLRGQYSENC